MRPWRAVPLLVRMTWCRWTSSIKSVRLAVAGVLGLLVLWAVVEDYALRSLYRPSRIEEACHVLVTDTEGVWVEPLLAAWGQTPCVPVREVPGGGAPEEALADGRLMAWMAFDATSVAEGAVRVVGFDELPSPLDLRLEDLVKEVVVRATVERTGLTAARAQALATQTVWVNEGTGVQAKPAEIARTVWDSFYVIYLTLAVAFSVGLAISGTGLSRSESLEVLGTTPGARWAADAVSAMLRFVVVIFGIAALVAVKVGASAGLVQWHGEPTGSSSLPLPEVATILRWTWVCLLVALAAIPLAPALGRWAGRAAAQSWVWLCGVAVGVWPLTFGVCSLLNLEIPGRFGLGCLPEVGLGAALIDAPTRFETLLLGPATIGSVLAWAWTTGLWISTEGRPGWGERR